jgi:hypothetical protein
MHWVGQMAIQGMANGIDDYAHVAENAAVGVGENVIDSLGKTIAGLGDLIGGGMDLQPVVTPILDLSAVKKDAALLGNMLGASPISLEEAFANAKDAAAGYRDNELAATDEASAGAPNSLTFIQNNNSPKALSAAELYRQTNNQISVAKGALVSNANTRRS